MANIKSIEVEENKVRVLFEMSKEELSLLHNETSDLCVFPLSRFNEVLTTGAIGNSNRIMFPHRLLRKHNIRGLPKHMDSVILSFNGKKMAVMKLQDDRAPMPVFERD